VNSRDAVAVERVSLVLMETVDRVGVAVNEWVKDAEGGEAKAVGVRVPEPVMDMV